MRVTTRLGTLFGSHSRFEQLHESESSLGLGFRKIPAALTRGPPRASSQCGPPRERRPSRRHRARFVRTRDVVDQSTRSRSATRSEGMLTATRSPRPRLGERQRVPTRTVGGADADSLGYPLRGSLSRAHRHTVSRLRGTDAALPPARMVTRPIPTRHDSMLQRSLDHGGAQPRTSAPCVRRDGHVAEVRLDRTRAMSLRHQPQLLSIVLPGRRRRQRTARWRRERASMVGRVASGA